MLSKILETEATLTISIRQTLGNRQEFNMSVNIKQQLVNTTTSLSLKIEKAFRIKDNQEVNPCKAVDFERNKL